MATPTPNWKNGELQKAADLWAQGLSYFEIAEALGPTYTRNAVAAKAYDNKNMFPSRDGDRKQATRVNRVDRAELERLWNNTSLSSRDIAKMLGASQTTIRDIVSKHPDKFKKRTQGAKTTGKQKLNVPFLPAMEKFRVIELDEFERSRLPGLTLVENTGCKWPLSEGPFRFCGCSQVEGKPWCAHHQKKAFYPKKVA